MTLKNVVAINNLREDWTVKLWSDLKDDWVAELEWDNLGDYQDLICYACDLMLDEQELIVVVD